MDPQIIAAIIMAVATILAAIIGKNNSNNKHTKQNGKTILVVFLIIIAIISAITFLYLMTRPMNTEREKTNIPEGTWYSIDIEPTCAIDIHDGYFKIFSLEGNDGINGKMNDLEVFEGGFRFSINYVFSDTVTESDKYYYEVKYKANDKDYHSIEVRDNYNKGFVTYIKK